MLLWIVEEAKTRRQLTTRLTDYLMPDVTRTGGITEPDVTVCFPCRSARRLATDIQ